MGRICSHKKSVRVDSYARINQALECGVCTAQGNRQSGYNTRNGLGLMVDLPERGRCETRGSGRMVSERQWRGGWPAITRSLSEQLYESQATVGRSRAYVEAVVDNEAR